MKVLEELMAKRLKQLACDHEWSLEVVGYGLLVYRCVKCGKTRVE